MRKDKQIKLTQGTDWKKMQDQQLYHGMKTRQEAFGFINAIKKRGK